MKRLLCVMVTLICILLSTPASAYTTTRQDALHEAANMLRAAGYTDDSAPIKALSRAWWEEEYRFRESRYSSLELSGEDIHTIACIVYLEARGESAEGQRAVAEVVLNRVLSERFPDTVNGVIYQSGQFTPAKRIPNTVPEKAQYDAVIAAYEGVDLILETDVVYFSVGALNSRVYAVIGNHTFCRI